MIVIALLILLQPALFAGNIETEIALLLKGNERFYTNHPDHPHQGTAEILKLSKQQSPHTVMITCSDSRVPPEIIFDQGLGDFFTIRSAGHALSKNDVASIEYAVLFLGASNIVVMGHTMCGAVKASLHHDPHHSGGSKNLEAMVLQIRKGVGSLQIDDPDFSIAARNNARSTLQYILINSAMIRKNYIENKVHLLEGLYTIQTGKVKLSPLIH